MKPTATTLILALLWAVQINAADNSFEKRDEDRRRGRFSAFVDDTEDEEAETTSQSLRTGRFGVYQPVDQSTERETYRDVCTGYIEGTTDMLR